MDKKQQRTNRVPPSELILEKYTPSACFAKTDKPSSSREEKYALFTGCGIKNWRSGVNPNVKKDPVNGKSMSGRHNTCYPNPKDSWGMRSIKRPNNLSTGDWCLKQSASDVYIENVEEVQRNTRKKSGQAANKRKSSRIGHSGK